MFIAAEQNSAAGKGEVTMLPKVAIYVRLSKEDRNKANKEDESESIINQQIMLLEYCEQQEWSVYKIYNDEDFSGSDRERPEFNMMIKDAEEGKFDIVLAKTQSRFARDVEIVEKYINTLFPIWGIRFVGLVDNADSDNVSNRKSRQINSLVDQWYLEDLSQNIRATLASKRKQGLWVGAFAPYGYIKDPKNKNHLIVDEEAAEVVRYIFKLYIQGLGVTSIARRLNAEGIPNASHYKKSKGQPYQKSHGEDFTPIWKHYAISRMISNEIYIGNMVQGRVENISFKSNKKRPKPKAEWDIVEGTHEPIIDIDTWNAAQKIRESRTHATFGGPRNVFSGKIRCMRCGGSMRSAISQHMRYYRCANQLVSPEYCQGTTVSFNVLEREVLKEVKQLYENYLDENYIAEHLNLRDTTKENAERLHKHIYEVKEKLLKQKRYLEKLYYDYADGVINREEYLELKAKCQGEKERLELELETAERQLQEIKNSAQQAKNRIDIVREYANIDKLDSLTVDALIDNIEVGGNRNNRIIRIHWKV